MDSALDRKCLANTGLHCVPAADGLPLIRASEPRHLREDMVCLDTTASAIERAVRAHARQDALAGSGLAPPRRLLFHGPPGCGKSMAAQIIAGELSLPFGEVNIDLPVCRPAAQSAALLREVFDYVAAVPMVCVLDGLTDLPGLSPSSLASLLDRFDGGVPQGILVCTARDNCAVDESVRRRFDEDIEFCPPSEEAVRMLIAARLRGVRKDFDPLATPLAAEMAGMSHAKICRILKSAIGEMILDGDRSLNERHIASVMGNPVAPGR